MFPKFLNTGPLISSYLPRANTKEKACHTIIFLESHLGVSISHPANEETDLSWRQTPFKYYESSVPQLVVRSLIFLSQMSSSPIMVNLLKAFDVHLVGPIVRLYFWVQSCKKRIEVIPQANLLTASRYHWYDTYVSSLPPIFTCLSMEVDLVFREEMSAEACSIWKKDKSHLDQLKKYEDSNTSFRSKSPRSGKGGKSNPGKDSSKLSNNWT